MIIKKYTLYSLTNSLNGKVYIGITCHLGRRINTHKYNLRKGIHGNKYLQEDYDKNGWSAFLVDVISEYDSLYEAGRVEKYYTDCIFGLNKNYCYNIASGGLDIISQISRFRLDKLKSDPEAMMKLKGWFSKANRGKPCSEEKKNKIRIAHIGKKASDATKQKMSISRKGELGSKAKKVIDTKTGKIYGCLKDAVPDFNVKYDTLRARINGYNNVKTTLKWL